MVTARAAPEVFVTIKPLALVHVKVNVEPPPAPFAVAICVSTVLSLSKTKTEYVDCVLMFALEAFTDDTVKKPTALVPPGNKVSVPALATEAL